MTSPPSLPGSPPAALRNTTLGLVFRIAFFIFAVYLAIHFIIPIFHFFGVQIANTVGVATAALAANLLTLAIFDRRPLVDIGLRLNRASLLHFLEGIGMGAGAAVILLTLPLLLGEGHLVLRPHSEFAWPSLIFYLITLFFAASGEEMIFHGYAFQALIQKIGPYATVLPFGVIFGLLHAENPNANPLGVVNTILWGIMLGCAFLRSHDLWLPIGIHFGWNSILPLFGVNLSGLTIEVTRYIYKWDLPPIWSGGAYGPEGGLLTTIFGIILLFALYRAPLRPQYASIATCLNEPDPLA